MSVRVVNGEVEDEELLDGVKLLEKERESEELSLLVGRDEDEGVSVPVLEGVDVALGDDDDEIDSRGVPEGVWEYAPLRDNVLEGVTEGM